MRTLRERRKLHLLSKVRRGPRRRKAGTRLSLPIPTRGFVRAMAEPIKETERLADKQLETQLRAFINGHPPCGVPMCVRIEVRRNIKHLRTKGLGFDLCY